MPRNLFVDFKEGGYHSSILSTYSVDPAFYDASLQFRLRTQGCLNNLLIADAAMLGQALEILPEAFQNAGRKYLIAPITSAACFHAKLALRYGKSKAKLTIGSANVTSAGWAGNLELISSLAWQAGTDNDSLAHQSLIIRAHQWLTSLLGNDDGNVAYKLELLRNQSPWLESDNVAAKGPFHLADGSEIDLLVSDPSHETGLADRMLNLVGEKIDRLAIISPYWDSQLTALKRLHAAVGCPDLRVFIALNSRNPSRSSTFPADAMGGLTPIFHPIQSEGENSNRFLHAKMFLFQSAEHDFFFSGSANCTTAALGTAGKPGVNHECLLYRKMPRGTVEQHLNLSFKSTIASSKIAAPPENEPSAGPEAFAAGSVERRDGRLYWLRSSNAPNSPVSIQIGETDLPLRSVNGSWHADIGDATIESNIARICLADGRKSRPMIIGNPDELRRFAPFPIANALRKKLDAVLYGGADLISLVKDIHLLLEDDGKISPALERVRAISARSSTPTVAGRDYATPEEFRNALNLNASMKSTVLPHSETPALQSLLQIVLRGMVSADTIEQIDARDVVAAKSLDIGEDQDDVGQPEATIETLQPTPLVDRKPEGISAKAFQQNQDALDRGIRKFRKFLEQTKAANTELDLNFVTRSLFMLYLMLHGCTKLYEVEGSEPKVLIPFSGGPGEDIRDSFLFVAAQIITEIWGPDFKRSLVRRLNFKAESDVLPVQITTLTVISRWVLAAILSEVRGILAAKSLRSVLENQVPILFAATKVFPELDPEEMLFVIGQLEDNIGMDPGQASQIHATLYELEKLSS